MASSNSTGRVLIATEVPFWEGDSGAAQRVSALIRSISDAGHEVSVFYTDRLSKADRRDLSLRFNGVAVATPSLSSLAVRALRRRLGGWMGQKGLGPASFPRALQRPWIEEKQREFKRLVTRLKPRAIIFEYLMMAYLLEALPTTSNHEPLLILDTIDVLSERARRFSEQGKSEISGKEEAEVLARFDVLLAIQKDEATKLAMLMPGVPVATVGHAISVVALPERADGGAPTALFIGSRAAHNEIAVRHLLDNIWPEVLKQLPAARLLIAGAICDGVRHPLPQGVALLGPVEKVEDAYRLADIVVNPVTVGSGLKIKNVEALAFGMPLVTTDIGAEGLDWEIDAPCVVVDDMRIFASSVVELLSRWQVRLRYREQASAYASRHFSEERVYAPLLDILRNACYRGKQLQ